IMILKKHHNPHKDHRVFNVGLNPLTGNKQTHKIMPTIRLLFTVMDNIGDPPPGMTHHNLSGCGSDKNNKWHTIEFSNNIRTL
ncbi:hypothetical protein, partial [Corynebacterium glutamicum]|uniref:hypothetical protein n=2 Tax=Corynebacterium glutamicum TaxID=1718 RepID=UPI001C6908CC